MTTAELLAEQLDETRRWTLMLLADLRGDDWGFQPAPGMGHVLWLCGHLASAQNALVFKRTLGRDELDPAFAAHFPIGQDVRSVSECAYPTPAQVLKELAALHAKAVVAVRGMSDAFLAEPAFNKDGTSPHPHYRNKCGAISHAARHEAFHAGQIASIRRLLGKSFLR